MKPHPISSHGSAKPGDMAVREYHFFRRLALLTLMLSCAIAISLNLVDPDLWGHVLYGQELLATWELPETATHTFTAENYPWVNHENLAEIAFAVGFEHIGNSGMLFFKCMWGMAILGLMVWVARSQGVDALTVWAVALLVSHNLIAFFPMRPQLLSFMWLALMLTCLHRAFFNWDERQINWKWLAPLPLIVVLWTNSHGAFVAGTGILVVYLLGRGVEIIFRQRKLGLPIALLLAALAFVSTVCTLINPYGLDLSIRYGQSMGQPRPEITEWVPPLPGNPVFMPFVLLVVVMVCCLIGTRRRRDWTQIVILALVTWQAASHLRHIAFLAILCGFWLPPHVQSAVSQLRPKNMELSGIRLSRWVAAAATVVLSAAIGILSVSLFDRFTQFPVERDRYPVDAIQFMADHEVQGKLVVSFNWAQYAIAALKPDVQVAFDGRFRTCYPQEVVDMHFDFLLGDNKGRRQRSPKSGPIDGHRVLQHEDPDLVLVDRTYPEAVNVMHDEALSASSPWTLLYQDGTAQLWGRRSKFDDPALTSYVAPAERMLTNTRFESSEPWPAFPVRRSERIVAENSEITGQPEGSVSDFQSQPL